MIDWLLVLEFVKALAGPVATVTAAVLVARFAITNFRAQKLIERRLDWHEQVHRALYATSDAYTRADYANKINDSHAGEAWGEASLQSKRLAELCGEAWLYASQSGFAAIDEFQQAMKDSHVEFAGKSTELARTVNAICMSAASKLSTEMRADMRIDDLYVAVYQDRETGRLEVRADKPKRDRK